jgi:hypothetical protein
LKHLAAKSEAFAGLVQGAMNDDVNRGCGAAPQKPQDRFARMFELLSGDALWAKEYEQFVHDKSFASANELISFGSALDAVRRLANHVNKDERRRAKSED